MSLVDSVNYKIPGDKLISAIVGKEYYLTPFRPTGEIVKEIHINPGDKALIVTETQAYRISWWRIVEWHKETTTGA